MELAKTVLITLAAVVVAGICLQRADMMRGKRAKWLPQLSFVGMFMSSASAALAAIPRLNWDLGWILLWFLISVLALMYASRESWFNGVPTMYIKDEFKPPKYDRRQETRRADDRRQGGRRQDDPSSGSELPHV